VWDFILQNGINKFPCIIDYIAIAMILNIRSTLIVSDNSGCFTALLKYPSVADISQLLDLALQLMSPKMGQVVPQTASTPSVVTVTTSRRDKVVSDISSVIDNLRKSAVASSVGTEIGKLEEIITFLKLR
jgi:hypothetical protein